MRWVVVRRLGLCRLTSTQPLIGSTTREFFISSALWVLEVYCVVYLDTVSVKSMTARYGMQLFQVNWLTMRRECRKTVFWSRYCTSCTPLSFFPYWRISLLVMPISPNLIAVLPSAGVRVAVTGSPNRACPRQGY